MFNSEHLSSTFLKTLWVLGIFVIAEVISPFRAFGAQTQSNPIEVAMKKNLLFDFDGTICDSYLAALEIFNSFADEHHYKKFPVSEAETFRAMGSRGMFAHLGVGAEELPKIISRVIHQLHDNIKELRAFDEIDLVLKEARAKGFRVGVVTSNSEKSVRLFSQLNHLEFDFVYGDGPIFGKHELIKKAMTELHLKSDNTLYVGDETRDVEAAHLASIPVIAVSWGFNSEAVLRQAGPEWLANSPIELVRLLQNEIPAYFEKRVSPKTGE